MSDFAALYKPALKALLTLLMLALTAVLIVTLWRAYVIAPWTRDGRVSAQTVQIAPEISGTVIEVAVHDDQYVKQGEVLYRIDPARFELAVEQAQAQLEAATATLRQKTDDARRRRGMEGLIPVEDIQRAKQAVAVALAEQRQAQALLDMARLDLERSVLRAPVDAYVTRLRLNPGDYAVAGQANIALLDAHSFWMTAYFEETKLPAIHPGAPAQVRLMGATELLQGKVVSIGRGITDPNQHADGQGLPSVEPSFSWVRLAQRIPVRIEFDSVPDTVLLVAGMTGSIEVIPADQDAAPRGYLVSLLHRWL
ncbi:HlyD family secretion protein [Alcaligenes faecalis]|uniref:efflux RND transporter periplasmic adaptor subunit n=1 Tax=Alcaligenes faecalis TaxID=511 RepID=UPI001B37A6B9|nr:HlyD family secretion protein [Alcaligenes faecalis]MBQ0218778.1 HlyD family secretion protein [Alcaligenes faecalis]